jgi:NADH:ubiquinone oxidoreductase subunit 6 (subunit J)
VGIELALFILVGGVAVLAAVLMLVSQNAVHSALFLIVNFACVAFLYLMLQAAFLAMVQIVVYAGAIMVLFLFVIMLLGAERMMPETEPHFPWLTPAVVGVTLVLLLLASVAIVESDIDASEPNPAEPQLRIVHAVGNFPGGVDVYLDNEEEPFVEDLTFAHGTEYEEWERGEYEARVFPHGTDPAEEEPLFSSVIFLNGNDVITWLLLPDLDMTAAEETTPIRAVTVVDSLEPVERKDTGRLIVVHAWPCEDNMTNCPVDMADITVPSDDPGLLIEDLNYGEVSEVEILNEGEYTLGIYPAGEVEAAIEAAEESEEDGEGELDLDDPIVRLRNHEIVDNTGTLWVVTSTFGTDVRNARSVVLEERNENNFGGPAAIGFLLFTDYALPFEMIAILLLAAMVGVIVLTKPFEQKPRVRKVRRMANVPGNPTVDEYVRQLEGKVGRSRDTGLTVRDEEDES